MYGKEYLDAVKGREAAERCLRLLNELEPDERAEAWKVLERETPSVKSGLQQAAQQLAVGRHLSGLERSIPRGLSHQPLFLWS